jgi:hypothetical protein
MSATILRFPGFLLADDGKGFWKDGKIPPGRGRADGQLVRKRALPNARLESAALPRGRQQVSGRRRMTSALFDEPERGIAITRVVLECSIVDLRPPGEGDENLSGFFVRTVGAVCFP